MPAHSSKIQLPTEPQMALASDERDDDVAARADARAVEDMARVFSDYRCYVAKIGRRILGNPSDVEDLIQDVFVATLRDVHNLRDPERLRPWLATVTTRMAKRHRFKRSSLPTRLDEDPAQIIEETRDEAPGPESRADLAGNLEQVLNLPEELRMPWVLKHVEGRTLEDVAERCECSLATAQRRIQSVSRRITRRL